MFGRKQKAAAGSGAAAAPGSPPTRTFPEDEDPTLTDWADRDAIRAEWPSAKFDSDDRMGYDNGMRLSQDASMPPAQRNNFAEYITRGLRHALYDDGLLSNDEIMSGAMTIFSLLENAPTPESKISLYVQRLSVRLALAVVKIHGWQPQPLGGDGSVPISPTSPVVVDAIRYQGVDDSVAVARFFGNS